VTSLDFVSKNLPGCVADSITKKTAVFMAEQNGVAVCQKSYKLVQAFNCEDMESNMWPHFWPHPVGIDVR